MAQISLTNQISVSSNGKGLPIDIRQQVDEYLDMFSIYDCYPGMHIYVKHPTSTKDYTYPEGEYVVTKVESGTGKPLPGYVYNIEDYLHISDKVNKPLESPTKDNFASFDENGNMLDSTYNKDSFAPIEQAVPVGDTEDVGKILEKKASGFGWVDKPVDGKSALDIYNELNPEAQLDEDGFIAKMQQKYPMKHAAYYRGSVSQTIGTPFTGALDGDALLPTSDTMGNLYIMPNSDTTPTGSIAFTTINTGENQYAWVSLGAVDIPDNALTEDDVDDECIDGSATKPASAKAVSDLKYRLYGEGGTVNKVFIESNTGIGETLCNSKWIICKEDNTSLVSEPTHNAVRYYSGGKASYVINLSKYGNAKKLYVRCHYDYNAYITFMKKSIGSIDTSATSFTLQRLIEADALCSVHYNSDTSTWKNAISIPYNNGELQEIDVPDDAKYAYIAGRMWLLSIDTFEGSAGRWDRRIPSYLELEYEVQDAENSDIGGLNEAVTKLRDGLESTSSQGDELYNEVYGEFEEVEKSGYSVGIGNVIRGIAPDRGEFINGRNATKKYAAWEINVKGWTKVRIVPSQIATLFCITKSDVPHKTIKGDVMWNTYCDKECYQLNDLTFSTSSVYRATISEDTIINLTDDSKFLYIKICDSDGVPKYEPQSVTLYKEERVGGLVELKSKTVDSIGSSTMITLVQGYYNNDGNFVASNNFVTTSPIPMYRGCHFRLFDNYRIYQAYLFDNNGNLVNTNEMYAHQQQWANAFTNPWRAIILPQFFIRFKIGTTEGEDGDVGINDKIFKEFAWLDNPRLKRKIPTNASMRAWATNNNVTLPDNYDIEGAFPKVHKRTNTLLNVLWKPVRNPIAGVALGSTGTGINYGRAGQLMHGAPYSEPSEYNKYIGNHVSIRTFLTAVLNPRSVVYTENLITGGESSYGLSHHVVGSNAEPLSGPYYGTVCTGYTSYAQGRENIRLSDQFSSTSGLINLLDMYSSYETGTRLHPYPTLNDGREPFDIIEPLDILWYTGHGMLVTDVYTDEFGRNKYVVITEQTIPVTRSSVYTRETFRDRFVKKVTDESGDTDKWTIYRFCDWTDDIYESDTTKYYDEDTELTQREFDDYAPLKEASVEDEDIQCFAGDYAAFAIGDPSQDEGHDPLNNNKMYLNIRRGGENGYTHLQVFNENADVDVDSPIADLSIADGSNYVDSTTVIMSNDRADDYIIFDLASYWNALQDKPFGKFKARVVRKVNGEIPASTEGEKYVTGCVHFEMLYVNFEMTKVTGVEGATYKCEFGTSGIPYLIRKEKRNGMPQTDTEPKFLKSSDYESDEDVNSGNVYVDWTKGSTHIYAKLYIRGEYGVVVRRLEMPI